ncbi:hypothetical protein PR003_g28641 [Phytophthora rubi]|uniref:Uncharacterized protein n=1 Tax=Phytophthora rubi TaxID=129364 RepID=A0A6A4BT65_9STRA|nr:hypothetical protein PR001_g27458 [Phytophthora rubi]KAE8970176.1 hypothetical protein PR002_g27196 [Phytophthora rubi]KAE9278002.1 hypothetical protein PR003_g28641 [Phytophthora rubi]
MRDETAAAALPGSTQVELAIAAPPPAAALLDKAQQAGAAPRGSRVATSAPPRRPAGATAAAAAPAAALPDKAQQPDETTGKELKVDDDGVPHDALEVPITTINARTDETTQSRMFTRSMD